MDTTTAIDTSTTAAAAPLLRRPQGSLPVPRGQVEGLSPLVRVLLFSNRAPAPHGLGGLGVGRGGGAGKGGLFGRPRGDVGLRLGGGRGGPLIGVSPKADDGAWLLLALSEGAEKLRLVMQGADAEGGVEP